MVCDEVVLTLDILNVLVILLHLKKPSVHARGFSLPFKNTGEGLMVSNYRETCTPEIVVEVSTSQNDG